MAEVEFRVATEFNVVRVVVPADIQERVDRLIAENRCLGCERKIQEGEKVRLHQCPTCSSGTYNALKYKRVTRAQLLSEGKIAPGKKGPKPKNDYTASLQGRVSK